MTKQKGVGAQLLLHAADMFFGNGTNSPLTNPKNDKICFWCAGKEFTNQDNKKIPCPFCEAGEWQDQEMK